MPFLYSGLSEQERLAWSIMDPKTGQSVKVES